MQDLKLEMLIDNAIENAAAEDAYMSESLGASIIGGDCTRALWYGFRWYLRPDFPPRIRRRFETGHAIEARVVEYLRQIGMTVSDENPRGRSERKQWYAEQGTTGGLLRGYMDGIVTAPAEVWRRLGAELDAITPVLLEVKAMGSSKYEWEDDTYTTIVANKKGDRVEGRWFECRRRGVKKAQPGYYAQMQAYMGMSRECDRSGTLQHAKWGLARPLNHALFIAYNTDTEQLHAELVEYEPAWWDRIKARAITIIRATEPPERKSQNPGDWTCRFCDFRGICHHGSTEEIIRSCRSCVHARIKLPGDARYYGTTASWLCDQTKQGCGDFTACSEYTTIQPEEDMF